MILAASAAPAFAQDTVATATPVATPLTAAAIRPGTAVRDAKNVRLGKVDKVNADGSIGVIFMGRFVTLPASTLSMSGGTIISSLTKSEISRMK